MQKYLALPVLRLPVFTSLQFRGCLGSTVFSFAIAYPHQASVFCNCLQPSGFSFLQLPVPIRLQFFQLPVPIGLQFFQLPVPIGLQFLQWSVPIRLQFFFNCLCLSGFSFFKLPMPIRLQFFCNCLCPSGFSFLKQLVPIKLQFFAIVCAYQSSVCEIVCALLQSSGSRFVGPLLYRIVFVQFSLTPENNLLSLVSKSNSHSIGYANCFISTHSHFYFFYNALIVRGLGRLKLKYIHRDTFDTLLYIYDMEL